MVRTTISLALVLALIAATGCDDGSSSPDGDAGLDGGSTDGTGDDTPSDPEPTDDVDSASTSEPDTEPRAGGEPCWKEVFGGSHPNFGLPDCAAGLTCIGDDDEAWCTESCALTGATSADAPYAGWCCAELAPTCDPLLFWLPESMGYYCLPRTAELGAPCYANDSAGAGYPRCRPRCDAATLISETYCAVTSGLETGTTTFCTVPCAPAENGLDCIFDYGFTDGCCGDILGGSFCLPAALCG